MKNEKPLVIAAAGIGLVVSLGFAAHEFKQSSDNKNINSSNLNIPESSYPSFDHMSPIPLEEGVSVIIIPTESK